MNYLSLRVSNLNVPDPLGHTVLSRLVLMQAYEIVFRLISRGAMINFQNREGRTALILAVIEDNFEAVRFLLEKGADPHLQDL